MKNIGEMIENKVQFSLGDNIVNNIWNYIGVYPRNGIRNMGSEIVSNIRENIKYNIIDSEKNSYR